ncbi:MAG: agmatine deiminase family protein [Chitinophagales bacterium]|nr:agmatine deiminase family protein [Chitinophagales bacterium]
MPAEWATHEGTWLTWPHDSTYGQGTRDKFESAWIEMTRYLVDGEKVHIIAYSQAEKDHIVQQLNSNSVSLDNVDFFIHPSDDYWIRDNGPIFVNDLDGQQVLTDWGFNGWGNDAPYSLDDLAPALISSDINVPAIDLNAMILEGGAIENDGNGTLMATRSSITGDGRNPGLTETEIEDYLTTYLGVTNFIWLDGKYGGNFDITDSHIDGFAKFHDSSTIVTMNSSSLTYWFVSQSDQNILYNAVNVNSNPYNYVYLPLTKNIVKTTWGASTGSKGSYVNYYVANEVVLVPIYADQNDAVAIAIIQELFAGKQVIGIDCRNMFSWGGMVHCVTQHQPLATSSCSLIAAIDQSGTIGACKGTEVTLTCENTGNGITYQWRKDGTEIIGATAKTYVNSKDEASFDVVVASGTNCSDVSESIMIDRFPKPTANITPQGSLDICNTGTVALMANAGNNFEYKWKKDNVLIAGATGQVYNATQAGNYKVVITNKNGCVKNSGAVTVFTSCRKGEVAAWQQPSVYPNPAQDFIYIDAPDTATVFSIINACGQVLFEDKILQPHHQVNVSALPKGLYVIRIVAGDVVQISKFVKN